MANYSSVVSKPLYVRTGGKCTHCGYCCEFIYTDLGTVFSCFHLRWKDGKSYCADYAHRPSYCRAYPQVPNPLNPKCGYEFEWIGDDENGEQ